VTGEPTRYGTYFISGPRMRWPGVVEALDSLRYYHHERWPERSDQVQTLYGETIETYVDQGHWAPAPDHILYAQELRVEEGL
jgi:hypothetical protein